MSLRVLVVDDSPAMRVLLKKILGLSGLPIENILDASDGVEGLTRLRSHPINLILTDINMPNMDGEEFVRQVKADKNLREIPVIMITTDNSTARVLRLRQLGAQGYLCKPFTPAMVKEKVLALMSA
ncbi:MAG TPA: response regulator [Bryobacteraceae bacterium]|jgi:two-component system chemotaxis response regulator CheY